MLSRRLFIPVLLAAVVAVSCGSVSVRAHDDEQKDGPAFDADSAFAYSQKAVGRIIGNLQMFDRRGRPVQFSRFRGKPLVISLMYTSCAQTCPLVTQNLARIIEDARDALGGKGFAVASIGFDTRNDNSGRMRIFAREQGLSDTRDWWFLSANAATMKTLTHDLGFAYFRTPKGFDHITQTTILDAEGRVYQHIYGTEFDAPRIVEPLRRLAIEGGRDVPNTISNWIDRVRLFCTVYDPARDRYRFDYSLFVAIGVGIICFSGLGVFLVHAWRGSRRSPPPPTHTIR